MSIKEIQERHKHDDLGHFYLQSDILEQTHTDRGELLDVLKEIGDHIEARRALGCAGDFGGIKAILDKLCAS